MKYSFRAPSPFGSSSRDVSDAAVSRISLGCRVCMCVCVYFLLKTCTCEKGSDSSTRDVMSEGRVEGAGFGDSSWMSGNGDGPIRRSRSGSRSCPSLYALAPVRAGIPAPGTSCHRKEVGHRWIILYWFCRHLVVILYSYTFFIIQSLFLFFFLSCLFFFNSLKGRQKSDSLTCSTIIICMNIFTLLLY